MAVTCHVRIDDEKHSRQLTFAETPRIGEFVLFSRDGQRDENGVLHGERFKVKYTFHIPANDDMGPAVILDVVEDSNASRT